MTDTHLTAPTRLIEVDGDRFTSRRWGSITYQLAAACTALAAVFAASHAAAAEPVEKLWFTDSHATAFYAIDEANSRVIVITETGPQGHVSTTRTAKQLADGERWVISQDGHGRNALTATLVVTRSGANMDARITTTPRESSLGALNHRSQQ
ncbi:MAG: hypothetical protein U1A72_00410 [Sulfuritalea sp.]|nr:hypothetical protein [Sulfuritalea sp.]